ncbi:glycosyltransferase family 2 protein [Pedobacter sp. MC2016-14]|uniref:glycosyltransferase family 2 protein n=1 Tax=Pedobacter sp. MC2016-14 TaxID=2897327 RepID=UPI001E2E6222|nr:glycosyltransferase family 2 protein [Pedobacter sp. MC2016-14]MCD0487096.1 glycosyltransferase family 2 protein [Pedobacter sp. MC2016-14]
MNTGISVVLPNYNGRQLLATYLPYTYAALNRSGMDYELIVVDDCSTDDSVNFLETEYPDVMVLQNEQNVGFSKTCNAGIIAANKSLTLLLNTDVKLSPDYFEGLISYFDHPETFGVMGRIIGMEDEFIQDAARIPGLSGFKIQPSRFYYAEDPTVKVPTLYLSGANALIATEKLQALEGFNEIFSPFYGEDLDLGLRAWRNGWTCYYHHNAICRHQISSTTKNLQKAKYIKMVYFRNRYIFYHLHWNGFNLILLHLQLFFTDFLFSLLSFKAYKIKAYLNFWKMMPAIIESKNSFAVYVSWPNVSLKQVVKHLSTAAKQLGLTKVPKGN